MAGLIRDANFAGTLMEALSCGVLVVDEKGSVHDVNTSLELMLGSNRDTLVGKDFGNVMGCRKVRATLKGCGLKKCCQVCEARKLFSDAIAQNKKLKGLTGIQILTNGQARNLTTLLEVAPFMQKDRRYAVLMVEAIARGNIMSPAPGTDGFRGIVGRNEKTRALIDTIRQVAPTDSPVLIQGESGTGKELVAQAIHDESQRARRHFVPINCGALPEGLIETELFGHVKGAFTGAIRDKKGRFALADGGTLFLDEVGELNPHMQVKLLRVLEDGGFWPVGSEQRHYADVRVVSASNRNLEAEVAAGRFRQDLFYRLCVMPIDVPPLRERSGDLALLVDYFLAQYCKAAARPKAALDPAVLALFQSHAWPGNVRELQNVLHFALIRCRENSIQIEHLPATLQLNTPRATFVSNPGPKLKAADVRRALNEAAGNKRRCAEILGVSRSTLYRFFDRQKNHRKGS